LPSGDSLLLLLWSLNGRLGLMLRVAFTFKGLVVGSTLGCDFASPIGYAFGSQFEKLTIETY
jgi:hypothetical protein